MQEISLDHALNMAGIDRSDDDLVRDLKLADWLKQVNGEIVSNSTDPVGPKTQIKIIKKENK